jgi:hypothetical protein
MALHWQQDIRKVFNSATPSDMRRKKKPKLDKLYYYGTDIDVRLGDRIVFRRLCGPIDGTVSYIPGVSPRHAELESDFTAQKDWTITLADGGILAWLYAPEHGQPSRQIMFVERGLPDYRGIQPSDVLDDD